MSGTVSEKSIIVKGPRRGVGAAIACDVAANGAKVCLADPNIEAARKVAAEIGNSAIAAEDTITGAMTFLASAVSDCVTGQSDMVDRGMVPT